MYLVTQAVACRISRLLQSCLRRCELRGRPLPGSLESRQAAAAGRVHALGLAIDLRHNGLTVRDFCPLFLEEKSLLTVCR